MEDHDIYIDDSMSLDAIDDLGLTVDQLQICFLDGTLSHLTDDEVRTLGKRASERAAARMGSTNVHRD